MSKKAALKCLLLTASGSATLLDGDDNVLWASDQDDDFAEEFGEDFLHEEDADEVIGYLVDKEYLAEGEEVDIEEETIEPSANDNEE